jgi:hypothetical protein
MQQLPTEATPVLLAIGQYVTVNHKLSRLVRPSQRSLADTRFVSHAHPICFAHSIFSAAFKSLPSTLDLSWFLHNAMPTRRGGSHNLTPNQPLRMLMRFLILTKPCDRSNLQPLSGEKFDRTPGSMEGTLSPRQPAEWKCSLWPGRHMNTSLYLPFPKFRNSEPE